MTDLICNGIPAKGMIDTGAAVTAVSTRFGEQFPQSVKPWKGPKVSLANGEVLAPGAEIEVKVILQNKSAQIFALILPLPNVDVLLGNDILRQFGDLKVHYRKMNEKDEERTITIPAQQETHIMLQQDVSIPAYAIVAVSTKTNTNANLYGKAWVVEPSAMLFTKKGVSLGHSVIIDFIQALLTNLTDKTQNCPSRNTISSIKGNGRNKTLRLKHLVNNQ